MNKYVLFILVFPLHGCVSINYEEPVDGTLAQIYATSNAEDTYNIHVREYSSKSCEKDSYKTLGLIKSKMIGTEWLPYLEKSIRAEEPFSISILATTRNLEGCWVACQPLVTFLPKENKFYDVEHKYTADKTRCGIDIYESDMPHNQGKRERIELISSCNKTPILQGFNSADCEE